MKAAIINQYGSPDELQIIDIAKPIPSTNQVLIKATALSLNPIDFKTRQGNGIAFLLEDKFPKILGWDVSGIVEQVGDGVTRFKVGDRVFGMLGFPNESCCTAEYVVANINEIALIPNNVTDQEAGATTLAALTALQALKKMGVKAGKTILIQAAAGGVGHFAVQLAKLKGLKVIGTGSIKNRDYVMQLGADIYIDYQQNHEYAAIKPKSIDYVLDTIGGDVGASILPYVANDGVVSILAADSGERVIEAAKKLGIKCEYFRVEPNAQDMQILASHLEKKQIVPKIAKIFKLADIQQAHKLLETMHVSGKIIITP